MRARTAVNVDDRAIDDIYANIRFSIDLEV
jgi:hypothetical protein